MATLIKIGASVYSSMAAIIGGVIPPAGNEILDASADPITDASASAITDGS